MSKDLQQTDVLALITKREVALDIIKRTKSPFVKRDRYKQVKKINEQLQRMGVE